MKSNIEFEYTGEGYVVPKNVIIVRFHPSVVEVEYEAFSDCKQLRKVVFNNGLQKIKTWAFQNCTSLSSITLPSTVTDIGIGAFLDCKQLREVMFNDGLQKIGRAAFYDCTSLSSINLSSTVTEVEYRAFRGYRNLSEVVFNDGLQKIGVSTFYDCTSLSNIILPSTLQEIGDFAFDSCSNLREVEFNNGLQKIGTCAFCNCNSLSSIAIPSTVTEICSNAFAGCSNLREVMFNGVPREIGQYAFLNCTLLERFTFPTISARLDNLIQTGYWEEMENEVNEVRGVVERSGGELIVSAQTMREGRNWNQGRVIVIESLDMIVRLISRYELKEGTSIFELALWQFKLDQVLDIWTNSIFSDLGGIYSILCGKAEVLVLILS